MTSFITELWPNSISLDSIREFKIKLAKLQFKLLSLTIELIMIVLLSVVFKFVELIDEFSVSSLLGPLFGLRKDS